MTNRFASYRRLAEQWPTLDFFRSAFRDERVKQKPTIKKLPRELSQQIIPPPQGTSSRVSSSLQGPPRTTGAPVNPFTRLALDQAAADGRGRNLDDGLWHRKEYPNSF
jgi:hypothetical protein